MSKGQHDALVAVGIRPADALAIHAYKNIQASEAIPATFKGISIAHKHMNLVLEIKNARSDGVEHRLTVQLSTRVENLQSGLTG